MLKRLKEMLAAKEAARAKIAEDSKTAKDVEVLRAYNAQMDALNQEILDLRALIADVEASKNGDNAEERALDEIGEARGASPQGVLNPLGTYGMNTQQERTHNDEAAVADARYGTVEYRAAFRTYIMTGQVTPALKLGERRADAMTGIADIAAVIPTTILDEVVRELKSYGQVYAGVRKLSIKGGVKVPISSIVPVATWIGEAPTSDKQKLDLKEKVSFDYYGLECKISTSLLADTVSLAAFESTVTELITEAIIKAIDLAIVKGAGTASPLGVTIDTRVPAGNKITLTPDEFKTWESWKKKVFAKMKLRYKAGAVLMMASGTFEGYIDGMVDTTGQPIGRTNYGIANGPQGSFGGKKVMEVEDDVIANYDDAATGDVVAIFINLKNYLWNSNMEIWMYRYFDNDTNEWVDKAILIADGKLLDPNGVILVKKGAAA